MIFICNFASYGRVILLKNSGRTDIFAEALQKQIQENMSGQGEVHIPTDLILEEEKNYRHI